MFIQYLVGVSVHPNDYNYSPGKIQDIVGIFGDKKLAESKCRSYRHFVMELELDQDLGDVSVICPENKCWYPSKEPYSQNDKPWFEACPNYENENVLECSGCTDDCINYLGEEQD